jgi:hypothetical protein
MKLSLEYGVFSRLVRRAKDERASILVQASLYIVVVLGMTGLAVDGGRYFILNDNLQNLADAAALAAAAQMDGSQNSLTNAANSAIALGTSTSNTPTQPWYDGSPGAAITSSNVSFYQTLTDVNNNNPTTNPKVAQFVKVTTNSWQTAPWFVSAVAFFTGSAISNKSTTATAVAQGNDIANCVPTQSFVCNPWEGSEINPGNASNFSSHVSVGQMVTLVDGAGAAGNWGLIQPSNGNNPHNFDVFWSASSVGSACTTGNSQGTTRPGNVGKFAQDGMNVRFDSPIGNNPPDESLSAPIVIDGFQSSGNNFSCNRLDPNIEGPQSSPGNGVPATPCAPNNWNANCATLLPSFNSTTNPFLLPQTNATNTVSTNTGPQTAYQVYDTLCGNPASYPGSCPLPRDRSFTNVAINNNSPWGLFQQGGGPNVTDLNAYWNNHHGSNWPTDPITGLPITRYQAYLQEASGTATFTAASDAAEPHGPTCQKSSTGNASRRVINVAVVDCQYWGIQGQKALPATTLIAQFFMTEPAVTAGPTWVAAGSPSGGGVILSEYIGSSTTGNSNCLANPSSLSCALHKIVQLVR